MVVATNTEVSRHQQVKCQGCGSVGLEQLLDLGHQPLCNEFVPLDQAVGPQTYYPLCLCYCRQCSLAQLDYIIPTDVTFGDQYTYLTGSSPSLLKYYGDMAEMLTEKFKLHPGDTVVEIGSNDGTFLRAFRESGIEVLGVEGAKRSSNLAVAAGVPVIESFFGAGSAAAVRQHLPQGSRVRLVVAMNVLAHTDNINEFLDEVGELMGPETVFISQSHWLMALIRKFEFDTIYHEHLRYYTLGSLMRLFERHGLHVFDAETTEFYGGSVLAMASKTVSPRSDSMKSLLEQENGVDVVRVFQDMKETLLRNKTQLLSLLVDLKSAGHRVVGLGAPMKASTLLNYYGITSDLIGEIAEVNELKVGTLVPGVRIPVVHEDEVFREQPDFALLLAWNMAEHIIPKYRSMGYTGKFIVPVPELEVVG